MNDELKRSDLDVICKKLDDIIAEQKEIKDKLTESNGRTIRTETKIEGIEKEQKEIKDEYSKIWSHFTIMKEELKKDLKEYIGIVVSKEAGKIKIWVYSMAGTIAIAIITYLVKQ